jgi:hypothetical protein
MIRYCAASPYLGHLGSRGGGGPPPAGLSRGWPCASQQRLLHHRRAGHSAATRSRRGADSIGRDVYADFLVAACVSITAAAHLP